MMIKLDRRHDRRTVARIVFVGGDSAHATRVAGRTQVVEPAGVAAAASRKAARGSSAARANDGTKADNAATPPTPLFAPSSMPDGDPWETPIPVVSPDVWHTPTGAAPTDRKVVALTFDDGPSEDTAAIVEILQDRGVPATFFIVGEQAKKRPEMVAELKAAGFALAAHSMTHPRLDELSESDAAAEVAQSIDLLNFGAGPGTVKCFRPPYGVWTLPTAQQVAGRGVAMVNWTTDSTDYRRPDPETITRRATTNLPDQAIVLLHDGPTDRANTVEALPAIIDRLQADGYEFVEIC